MGDESRDAIDLVRVGYDAVSERYRGDNDRPPEYSAWLQSLSARLPLRANVLDLGCGCGVPVSRELTALRHQVVGVDLSLSSCQSVTLRPTVASPSSCNATARRWRGGEGMSPEASNDGNPNPEGSSSDTAPDDSTDAAPIDDDATGGDESSPTETDESTDIDSGADHTEDPHTTPRHRIRRLSREFRSHPLATAGAVAGVLALLPPIISAVDDSIFEPLTTQTFPIQFDEEISPSAGFVVPRNIDQISRPPVNDTPELDEWAEDEGGVSASSKTVSFLARADQEEPTIILDIGIEVTERRPPISGTWFQPYGAGDLPPREVYVDLDQTPPVLRRSGGWRLPLKVSKEDVEAFVVVASTSSCYCFWQIELTYLDSDGNSAKLIVNDDGAPFETTAVNNVTAKTWAPTSAEEPWPPTT